MMYVTRFILIVMLCGIGISVHSKDGKEERIMKKYREVIQDISPDDWYTLASSADMCLKKDIITKEVAEWIDRSLEIKKTAYNLEIKGDYYMKNRLPDKAGKYYLEAIKVGLEEDSNFDVSGLQEKIAGIVDLST